ncbi:hypothetical protein Tsubulata_013652 [Turnera subulata]|uniref:Retrotransposon gag domain-containing protein n=1 Tax=Turnera subulata TaxID=218843 RepID=A0A9Q0JPZ4_9ROSI|nr:hypothetical protein Tsubulata_013652 [Turnera subulata]
MATRRGLRWEHEPESSSEEEGRPQRPSHGDIHTTPGATSTARARQVTDDPRFQALGSQINTLQSTIIELKENQETMMRSQSGRKAARKRGKNMNKTGVPPMRKRLQNLRMTAGYPNQFRDGGSKAYKRSHGARSLALRGRSFFSSDRGTNNSTMLELQTTEEAVFCRMMTSTFREDAQDWYNGLPSGSITSFADLGVAVEALKRGCRLRDFSNSLSRLPPTNIAELMERATEYIRKDDAYWSGRVEGTSSGPKRKEKPDNFSREPKKSKGRRVGEAEPLRFTPINTSPSHILAAITTRGDIEVRWPRRLRTPDESKDRSRYCKYHRDHGHDTEECHQLKREIERLIRARHLREFLREAARYQKEVPSEDPPRPPEGGRIHILEGKRPRKARRKRAVELLSVMRKATSRPGPISFHENDAEGVEFSYEDALVIEITLENFAVMRTLVDTGCVFNLVEPNVFKQMGIGTMEVHVIWNQGVQPNAAPLSRLLCARATLPFVIVDRGGRHGVAGFVLVRFPVTLAGVVASVAPVPDLAAAAPSNIGDMGMAAVLVEFEVEDEAMALSSSSS